MLRAAESVCCEISDNVNTSAEQLTFQESITELLHHHLIEVHLQDEGKARYSMLEPIRQYALNCLQESGDVEKLRLRHCTYFLELVEGRHSPI